MAVQIPPEIESQFEEVAQRTGESKDNLVREALLSYLEDRFAAETDFTEEQIARMKHSLAQLDRGEVVTSEQVNKKFEDWRNQRASH
jgi:predicted transcriptional regulator